ncbi:MAG: hypothetical protein U0269_00810 [Polyangiales bacterium]
MNSSLDTFAIVRYAAMALFGAIALRSLIRLLRRALNAPALVAMCGKLVAAGNYARLAKLLAAAEDRWVALLLVRALSLHIPSVGDPRGEQEHFRDAPAPGEPFDVAWKRAMDTAQNALRLEVLTDLGAAIGGAALAAIVASLGTYFATDRGSFSRNAAIAAVGMLMMFGAANSGRKTLDGLVIARRFCESLAQPIEQWDDARREGAKLADALWRSRSSAAQGSGTDV